MSLTGAWAWSVKWHFPEAYVLDHVPHPQPSPLWLLRPGLIVVLILCVLTLLSPLWLFSPPLSSETDFSLGHFSLLAFLQVSFHLRTSPVVYVASSKPVFLTNDPSLTFLTIMTSRNLPLDVFVSLKLNKLETPNPFYTTKSASFPGLRVFPSCYLPPTLKPWSLVNSFSELFRTLLLLLCNSSYTPLTFLSS